MNRSQRPVSPRVSVVVPAKNEAKNLRVVLPRMPEVHEVILVDGGSVDGTVEAAREVMPGIVVVRQTRKGKGNAMVCGMAAATGDVLVMFDADGSADPAEIERFVAALVAGADFAKGSRYCSGGGSEDLTLLRRLGNQGLNGVMNLMYRSRYSDLCYGYNAFWADMVEHLVLPSVEESEPQWGDGFEIEALIASRMAALDAETAEVPSVELARIHGDSNLRTFSDGWRVLKTLVAERYRWSQLQRQHEVGEAAGSHVGRRALGAEPQMTVGRRALGQEQPAPVGRRALTAETN